jgi:5-methylcytosine-specific restriction endonuclease McrA
MTNERTGIDQEVGMAPEDNPVVGTRVADQQRVLALEATRRTKGYKPGWLYYRCKDAGLLDAYEQLRTEGLVGTHVAPSQRPQGAPARKQALTIELVPATCWFSNVRSEVSEGDWKKLKRITFQKAKYRCEVCGGQGEQWPVECHEIWHYDDENLVQTLAGLIALCPSCHEVKHMGLAHVKDRGDIAAQHLARVNGWTMEETEKYIDEQFDVWRWRSKHEWALDISWLDHFGISVNSD